MVSGPPLDRHLADAVHDATSRYLQILDTLSEEGARAPSLLPGWSRAHVVAHVAHHGSGTARAIDAVLRGQRAAIFDSPAQRAADIESLAAADLPTLRERSLEAAGECRRAVGELVAHRPGDLSHHPVRIYAEGDDRGFDATELVRTRWREVEIHHADLAGGYGPADWPDAFTDYLLPVVASDRAAECDLLLVTPERDVVVGDADGLRVEGMASGLAWWLLGRPPVPELTGRLPQLSPWVRHGWATQL